VVFTLPLSIDGDVNVAIPDNEDEKKHKNERKMQAVPVTSNTPIISSLAMPQQTVVDANGQQFILMPFNQGQMPATNYAQMDGPAFNAGRHQSRGQLRGRGRSGRFKRGFTRHSGIFDAYCMDTAPINIFENQVLPTGLHDISKSFRPNLATTRVFSMGTKFIPVWKNTKIWKPFSKFQDFRRRMNNKMFFEETTPGVFVRNRKFGLKNNWWASTQYKEIDEFCYKIRDGIANIIESKNILNVQNLSKLEFSGLQSLLKNPQQKFVFNDSDKNLGATVAEKEDVIKECCRQLYDINTYIKLSATEAEMLLAKIKFELMDVVNKYVAKKECSSKEAAFLLSKARIFTIPHFYIIWKILKNPPVGRPIVAGYDWILTPASIFAGHFLKDFYSKFDSILTDSLSLVKFLEKEKFDNDVFVFTIDFKSLYTNIPVDDAINSIKELVMEFIDVIPNAEFVIELLNIILKNSLMTFNGEYFQQIFGVIMGTNVAPILANIYLAKLEQILFEKSKTDSKLIWPITFKRFIDDGFGITKANKIEFEYWVSEFNLLRDTITIDKFSYGDSVDFMDLHIYKADDFASKGKFDISIFQKKCNKYMYIPAKSGHAKHTIKNFISSELKRYVRFNTVKLGFLRIRNKFYARLRNRGYSKVQLKRLFKHVKYGQRMNLLSMSCEKEKFHDIRETEVESELIIESERLFMDVFAEVLNSQSENLPRCDVHNMSINVPPINVLPAKV